MLQDLKQRRVAPKIAEQAVQQTFDGVDEIRRGARENFAHGADHLKLFATGGVSSPGSSLTVSVYSLRSAYWCPMVSRPSLVAVVPTTMGSRAPPAAA